MRCRQLCRPRGGKGWLSGHLATHDLHGMSKRSFVGVFVGTARLDQQAMHHEVSEQGGPKFLAHQFGGFAAQGKAVAEQVGFQFIVTAFVLPALRLKRCELHRRGAGHSE